MVRPSQHPCWIFMRPPFSVLLAAPGSSCSEWQSAALLWSQIWTMVLERLILSMIYGVMGECIPSWTIRLSLKALLIVCRLGCGVQRVGAVDPAHECGQPPQGQVIMRCTRAAITEMRLSFKDGGMLMP